MRADDHRVLRGDVEILVGIEAEIRLHVAAERNRLLVEALVMSAARSRKDAQLDGHQPLGVGAGLAGTGAGLTLSPPGGTFFAGRRTYPTPGGGGAVGGK